MLVTTGTPSSLSDNSRGPGGHHRVKSASGKGSAASMGFLRAPQHHKVPSPLSESISERFSTILDNCQKKIRLFHGPSSLFTTLVTKARRKDRECSASSHDSEPKLYLEEAVLERKIPEADLRQLVEIPAGLRYEEWLASHTIDFFSHINLVYGTICEFCTMSGCPDMTGPATRQYLWFDEKGKKTRVAAPQYVDYVMTFTQKTINDECIFPTKFVRIKGPIFKGFFVQARDVHSDKWVGLWQKTHYTKDYPECSAVTHNHPGPKKDVILNWQAPYDRSGKVYFVATILQKYDKYWSDVIADVIYKRNQF